MTDVIEQPSAVSDAVVAPPRRARRITPGKVVGPAVVLGVIVGVWYLVADVVLEPRQQFIFPPPNQIVAVYGHWDYVHEMLDGLKFTAEEALLGLLIAGVLGIAVATAMSQAKWLESSVYPWLVVLQSVPILALTGVLSFFFGFSTTPRVIVCVLIAFFPMVSNTLFGLQSADRGMHDLFTLHHAGRFTRLSKLQFMAALPAIFAGLRVSAGLSVIGAIVGDIFFKQGDAGLGTLLSVYTSYLEGDRLFAAVGLSCALAIVLFLLTGWASRLVVGRWYNPKKD